MKNTKAGSPLVVARQLTPITEFIAVPKEATIAPEQLELSDLSSLPRNLTLLTALDSLKVVIRRDGTLQVKLVYRASDTHPWAQKYGAKEMAHAISDATGLMPEDEMCQSDAPPPITCSSWVRPTEVSWEFSLPLTTTGYELIRAVRVSDAFVKAMAIGLLQKRYPEASEIVSKN